MARLLIGTTPVQVAWRNPNRVSLSVQFTPSSIIAGNTGLIFGKWGSAPVASTSSNSWDFLLNSGAADGTNIDQTREEAQEKGDLWLVSDTAAQEVNIVEVSKSKNGKE